MNNKEMDKVQPTFKERASFYFNKIFPILFEGKTKYQTILNMISGALHSVLSVFAIKYILDMVHKESTSLENIVLASGIFALAYLGFKALNSLMTMAIDVKALNLRISLFIPITKKIMTMDFPYFEDEKFNLEIENAFKGVAGDSVGIQKILELSAQILVHVLTIIIFTIVLSMHSWIVVLVVVLSIIINFYLSSKQSDYELSLRDKKVNENRKHNRYNSVASNFNYGKDIRIYGLKDNLLNKIKGYALASSEYIKMENRNKFKLSFFENLSVSLSDFIAFAILGSLALNGSIRISDFVALTSLLVVFTNILNQFRNNLSEVYAQVPYVYDYYNFMDKDLNANKDGKDIEFDGPISIKFENVSFKYPGSENQVFENLNFEIDSGKTVALVGVNGAGKTSIVKLLTGLYKPTTGKIYLNGVDINEFSDKSLFDIFSVVFQETTPLALTVAENIATTDKDIDYVRVENALKKVGLYDKVASLENKMDQNVLKIINEDGVIFSGGENQKLMIARALYKKDANVMIMDEPTAALDALAEEKIYQEFDSYMGDKTGLFISHRLASTRFCDEIMFLDGGQIIDQGSHQELLERCPEYRDMYETQGKYYKEALNEEF